MLTGRECCRAAVQPGQENRLTLLYHDCYCNCCWSRRDFFFSVCFIVFMVEANAVAKRKTVMRGDEINRGTRQTTITFKTSLEAAKRPANAPEANHNVMQPETTGSIAEMIVPLGKQRREISHLITTRAISHGSAINFTCESTGQFWIAVNNGAS